jgi:hypothetical protein
MAARTRLIDLLATRATEGLSCGEACELEQALGAQTEFDADDLDLAAAAVYLAFDSASARIGPLPEHLRRSILDSR